MQKRIIAAMMLLSLWSGTASGAFALLAMPQMDDHAGDQTSSSRHSCCPGLHLMNPAALLVTALSPAMPCGDEHPCCAKRAPESPASLPAVTEASRPGVLEMAAPISDPAFGLRNDAFRSLAANEFPLPSYFSRSTVLRI